MFARLSSTNYIDETNLAPPLDTLGCFANSRASSADYFLSAHLFVFARSSHRAAVDRKIQLAWSTGYQGWQLERFINSPEGNIFRGKPLEWTIVLGAAYEVDLVRGRGFSVVDMSRFFPDPPAAISDIYKDPGAVR